MAVILPVTDKEFGVLTCPDPTERDADCPITSELETKVKGFSNIEDIELTSIIDVGRLKMISPVDPDAVI